MDKAEELRVLCLEDSANDVELIKRQFNKEGMAVNLKSVTIQSDFVKELAEFSPDIVLGDVKLPDFDGMSALKIVKEKKPDTPFIIVTGVMGEEWAVESLKNGAADYVLKNAIFKLAPAVKRALKDAEAERERRRKEAELIKMNETLRKEIERRQEIEKELKESIRDLERFNKIAVDRELQMEDLEKKVKELKMRLGERD